MKPSAEFDRYAANYDDLIRDPMRERFTKSDFFHRRKWIVIADFLKRHSLDPARMKWLDVGCGKGELLGYGRPHFAGVAGCDLSGEMVRHTQGLEVHLQTAPDRLPFDDEVFDLVTAVCVYHHVEEQHRVELTREIHRVLKPTGVFCMIEHNPYNPVTRLIVSRSPVDVDAHLLTQRQAGHYSREARLQPLESSYFLYLPENLYNKLPSCESLLRKFPLGGQYAHFARKPSR
jgi:SAM-dependent methyltransferase